MSGTTQLPVTNRLPRFARVPGAKPFKLTERDQAMIAHVARHRFLRSDQIFRLLGAGSQQKILRRLQALFHHRYLDRSEPPSRFRPAQGSEKYVYALALEGARLLRLSGDPYRWAEKNKAIQHYNVLHAVNVAEVSVSLAEALGRDQRLLPISREEILAGASEAQRRRPRPLSWSVDIDYNDRRERAAVVPDHVFGLRVVGAPEGKSRFFYFVEVDRGTMSLTRRARRQNSIEQKIGGYIETGRQWRDDPAGRPFDFGRFRVLFVTSSAERANNMCQLLRRMTEREGSAMFLFTDQASLDAAGIFGCKWFGFARGGPIRGTLPSFIFPQPLT